MATIAIVILLLIAIFILNKTDKIIDKIKRAEGLSGAYTKEDTIPKEEWKKLVETENAIALKLGVNELDIKMANPKDVKTDTHNQ